MTVHQILAAATPSKETFLTIGVFDGVHLGHQHILNRLKELAASKGCLPGVVTFRNHPRLILKPGSTVRHITSLGERKSLIRGLGIDLIVDVEFTREFSLLSARQFLALLMEHLKMRGLVVGPDFVMGHNREGDVPVLTALAKEMGFHLEVVEPRLMADQPVKSKSIRQLVEQGDVGLTSRMLGRPFALAGRVVHGEGRGKALGFPTANLHIEPGQLLPRDGIYATWAEVDGRRYQAASSVGVRPTFGQGKREVEAFIMDFEEDLYQRVLRLEFVRYLREERAFPTPEDLSRQMEEDVRQARKILGQEEKQSVAG